MRSSGRLSLCLLAAFTLSHSALAQKNCPSSPPLGEALTDGDGQRYPLAVGPVTWHLLGSGIYAVKGSDGRTHVAFAMAFTNPWSGPTTIQSVQVVDPSRNNQRTGTDRVLSLDDKEVTGQIRPIPTNSNGYAAGYTGNLAGGQSGVMYFDVTYESSSEVPCFLALRVHSVQPEIKVMPESTLVSIPLSVSPKAPIVIAPPFKGEGWMDANGCCLEIGPHRFVINAMNGALDPSEGFAVDWVKINREGMAFRTDGKKPEDWLCYGTDVLAVAPGTVVEVDAQSTEPAAGRCPNQPNSTGDRGESRAARPWRRSLCHVRSSCSR